MSNNKNKYMSTETIKQEEQAIYVWSKTERAGDIVTVENVKGEFTYFTDGTQIYTALIGEMLMLARDEANAVSLAKPFKVPVNTDIETKAPELKEPSTTSGEFNVMLEMLKKISSKNSITMPLEINVPSKEVYDLFKDQMDITKADLNEQILALVLSQINNLQEQLKPQAEEFIKNYYNGKSNRKRSKANEGTTRSTGSSDSESAPDITY